MTEAIVLSKNLPYPAVIGSDCHNKGYYNYGGFGNDFDAIMTTQSLIPEGSLAGKVLLGGVATKFALPKLVRLGEYFANSIEKGVIYVANDFGKVICQIPRNLKMGVKYATILTGSATIMSTFLRDKNKNGKADIIENITNMVKPKEEEAPKEESEDVIDV